MALLATRCRSSSRKFALQIRSPIQRPHRTKAPTGQPQPTLSRASRSRSRSA